MRLNNRQIVGLDIQDKWVKCIQIKRSSGSWEIQKVLQRDIGLPGDAEDSESFQNQMAYAIKSLLQEMGSYPPKKLVTCIRGRDASIKLLKLPGLADSGTSKKESIIKYELMSSLPVGIDQMSYGHRILEEGYNQTKVLAAAVKRSTLNRHLRALSAADIYPDMITTSSIALYNAFAEKDPESISNGNVGLISLRGTDGDVVICEDGIFAYARSFSFPASSGQQMAREIRNSFEAYAKSQAEENLDSSHHPISRVYLLTDDGKLPDGLSEDDPHRICPEAEWSIKTAEDDILYGIALTGAYSHAVSPKPGPLNINLMEQAVQEKMMAQQRVKRAKLIKLAPVIASVFLMLLSLALWWQVYESNREIQLLQGLGQEDKHRVERISQLKETEADIQKRMESISWAGKGYPMVSCLLYEISRAIPQDFWLKEVYIPEVAVSRRKKSQVTREAISMMYVSGYAYNQSQIEKFMAGLRQCDCFSDVKQESTQEVPLSGERVLEFTIYLNSEADNQSIGQSVY